MKTSTLLFIGALLLAISSYVMANSGIKSFLDLMQVQNFFGLLGVIGGCLVSWASKSPLNGNGPLSKMTGNGTTKLPPDVN